MTSTLSSRPTRKRYSVGAFHADSAAAAAAATAVSANILRAPVPSEAATTFVAATVTLAEAARATGASATFSPVAAWAIACLTTALSAATSSDENSIAQLPPCKSDIGCSTAPKTGAIVLAILTAAGAAVKTALRCRTLSPNEYHQLLRRRDWNNGAHSPTITTEAASAARAASNYRDRLYRGRDYE